ncbi:MAG: arginine--tRNA ligase [Pseudomonadales bacterium]
MNLRQYLDNQVAEALAGVGAGDAPAVVRQAAKVEFGHYQANGVMGAAKRLGRKPRELAADITQHLSLDQQASTEVAGPGFINITLKPGFVADELAKVADDPRFGVAQQTARKFVIDYSSPNLAKEMHIGHLRSTCIGDAAVKILTFLGHDIAKINHVGDWGAQFGSLLAYMDRLVQQGQTLRHELKDLERFYQAASKLFAEDEDFAAEARQFVVRLQGGDEACLALWRTFIDESLTHCDATYRALGVSLTRADARAESSYNDGLADAMKLLDDKGLLTESDGAKCVFLPEFADKDGEPAAIIVQKSDGGYPYMATDIVSTRFRAEELQADTALYFVDARQSLHFKQLFALCRAAGLLADQDFRHIPFGAILGKDGKPFKTREGNAVKLADVIAEAKERALRQVNEKNPDLSDAEKTEIARVVGVGAIKYAELSKNRTTDYVFDWDILLSFDGNTAPYLQYAYTRIKSIFRREQLDPASINGDFVLDAAEELSLAVKLLQFPETIEAVVEDYQANILCNYLFELSGMFMTFYEACPVLKAEEPLRASRLRLCHLTAALLQQGLALLGIETVEQM